MASRTSRKVGDAHLTLTDLAERGQVEVGDRLIDAPESGEVGIVQDNDLAVAGTPQIELNHVGTLLNGRCKRSQGVLALGDGVAAVGDGDWCRIHLTSPR